MIKMPQLKSATKTFPSTMSLIVITCIMVASIIIGSVSVDAKPNRIQLRGVTIRCQMNWYDNHVTGFSYSWVYDSLITNNK
ncbi:hypothetical protein BLOT_002258 [Blomia tropicalis]|nr:hypothetical protein BLOT_002258 [Blomia tropicalis]